MVKSTGIRVQERRERLGLSRAELAAKLKTTRMTVWRIENGVKLLDTEELASVAKALRTSSGRLVS